MSYYLHWHCQNEQNRLIVAGSKATVLKIFSIDVDKFHDAKPVRLWEGEDCEVPPFLLNRITMDAYEQTYKDYLQKVHKWFSDIIDHQHRWTKGPKEPERDDFDTDDAKGFKAFHEARDAYAATRLEKRGAVRPPDMFILLDQTDDEDAWYDKLDEDDELVREEIFNDYLNRRRYVLPYNLRAHFESTSSVPELLTEDDFEPFWTVIANFGHHSKGLIIEEVTAEKLVDGELPELDWVGLNDTVRTFRGKELELWPELNQEITNRKEASEAKASGRMDRMREGYKEAAEKAKVELDEFLAELETAGFKT